MNDRELLSDASSSLDQLKPSRPTDCLLEDSQRDEKRVVERQFSEDSESCSTNTAKMLNVKRTSCVDEGIVSCKLSEDAGTTTVSFHNITYEVKEKLDDIPLCGKMGTKEVLKDVSGLFPPGLNAIMGPTGSGKTSLLDILAKRKKPDGLKSGLVLINGEKPPQNFRLVSGYVVQDDVVMGTLTVRENLAFSANLRLSTEKFSAEQRAEKVTRVIEQLGLQDCADTKVGTEFIRGVSGGERKRVNIGMELILDPPVIFLDEPTTGLDANTANSIILLLYGLVREGRNIILSIHQPRYSIFSLFDRLILLQSGRVVYRGQASEAVEHFRNIGYPCPQYHNPADFFLDILGGDIATARLLGRMVSGEDIDVNSIREMGAVVSNSDDTTVQIEDVNESGRKERDKLLLDFQNSIIAAEEEKSMSTILETYTKKQSNGSLQIAILMDDVEYPNSFIHQLAMVSRRTVRNLIRNPMTSVAQLITMITFGILMGLIYFQLDFTIDGIQNRAGCIFFLVMMQVMANLSALELFIKQRTHFIHESASGYYRVSVYFLSQVFVDLIPNRLIPNTVFGAIIYFMMGFQEDVGKFFFFVLSLVLTAVSASSLAFCVSASVRVFALANILVALPYLLMMMFGGFLANTSSLLDWLEWIKWISIFRYGMNALTVNEMSGLVFINNSSFPGFDPNSSDPCHVNRIRIPDCTTGEDYMEQQNIPYGSVWDMWQNIVALACIACGFLLLSYIQLRRIEKFK